MKTFVTKYRLIMSISLQKLKKRTPPKSENQPAKKIGRFDGQTEEDVKKNTLKDILEHDLDLVFIGINPSLMAAHTGRYYAGPGNHFYKLLYESKLIPEPISYEADNRLLEYKIGLTNIVARATRSSADLSRSEIKKGAMFVHEKLKKFKPKIAIFNGKCIYEEFDDKYNKASFKFGLQPHKIGETTLWVVPSSSARCANFPRMQDKLHFYTSMKTYLAYLKGKIEEVNRADFIFEGRCRQAIPSTSKMWRRKGISAFANGGRIANKETVCMDTSGENFLAIPQTTEFIISTATKKDDNDSEKDSGVSTSQSDSSQELSQGKVVDNESNENDSSQQNDLRPKRRQQKKPVAEKKVQTRSKVNIPRKKRSQTIDFVSLIKQRLSNKKEVTHENEEEGDEEDVSHSQSKANVTGLKYENLRSNKSKRGFKIQTLNNAEDDIS